MKVSSFFSDVSSSPARHTMRKQEPAKVGAKKGRPTYDITLITHSTYRIPMKSYLSFQPTSVCYNSLSPFKIC